MKLSEKTLQDLKEKKISIEDLNDRCFINSQDEIEVDNILKLLDENICGFEQIVDKFQSIEDSNDNPCLYVLLENEKLFEELRQNNTLNKEDLRYLWSQIDELAELEYLSENTSLLKYIVDSISFKELVYNFKIFNELHSLLRDKELFEELIQNNRLNKEDLRYLLNKIDTDCELAELSENTSLLKRIIDKNILSFKDLVDKFKSIKDNWNNPCLYYLLNRKEFFEELFEELIQSNRLNIEDLKYLLNKIDDWRSLGSLCNNTSLIKYILNEFVLNKELVDRFNTIIETNEMCKDRNIHTLFESIECFNKYNKEILKLNELNEKVYVLNSFDLSIDQKDELIGLIQNNEIAQNRLSQIINNHLESNYDFESLMNYLKKKEKKSIMNI